MKYISVVSIFFAYCISFSVTLSYASANELNFKMLPNLKYNKTHQDIKVLQNILYDLGYYKSDEDEPQFSGKFDKELKNSILEFQTDNNLKITGEINVQTYAILKKFLDSQNEFVDGDISGYDTDFLDFYSPKKTKKKFNIFDCFLDPVCAHLK